MKKILILIFCGCLVLSCASSTGNREKKEKLAQAIKKEGDVFQSQGNYTAALAKLLEAEKLTPADPHLQNSLGLAYMGKKRHDLAVKAFKKALSAKPDYMEARNNLGAAYLRQEKWDTAIDQFNLVLDSLIYPTPQFPLTNIGWAYLGKQNYADAQLYFNKALDEKPGFITAVHGLAQVLLRTGQADRAIAYLHNHLRRNPDAAILHADLAHGYEAKGQLKQAVKSWELVIKLLPENSPLARKAESKLIDLR
ncbi:MAG: tetratricopeptide repeat protein [Desulfobacterales bacterium]|nr:tetratricopeptide repeat protein [Desulfobacterales bacterium]